MVHGAIRVLRRLIHFVAKKVVDPLRHVLPDVPIPLLPLIMARFLGADEEDSTIETNFGPVLADTNLVEPNELDYGRLAAEVAFQGNGFSLSGKLAPRTGNGIVHTFDRRKIDRQMQRRHGGTAGVIGKDHRRYPRSRRRLII